MLNAEKFDAVGRLNTEDAQRPQSHTDNNNAADDPRVFRLQKSKGRESVENQECAEDTVRDAATETIREPPGEGDDGKTEERGDQNSGRRNGFLHGQSLDDVANKEGLRDVGGAVFADTQAEHDEEGAPAAFVGVKTGFDNRFLLALLAFFECGEHGAFLHGTTQEDCEESDEDRDQERNSPAPRHELFLRHGQDQQPD